MTTVDTIVDIVDISNVVIFGKGHTERVASSLLTSKVAEPPDKFDINLDIKCMCDSDHEFIIDWIDIDPDKSQQIVYCKFCYLEGNLQKIDLEKLQSNTIINDNAKNNSTYRNEKS
uniref:Uncharacterized protein n=1 Tax=viral metagenome TaxID=1070528 RepID=A0A6C0ID17_9ZZZZ